jgi:[acyl-carrier-protein] S-malonyltransferase
MGRDLYERYDSVRQLYERADELLGRPLSHLCFEGPLEELSKPSNNQTAIFVTSIACLTAGREAGALGLAPRFVAGHSLGEYSALVAADALDFDAGVRLVDERARLTQQAADANPGGMAAILGLDEDAVQTVCTETGVQISNVNAPGQIVVGGPVANIQAACTLAAERGARRAIRLDIGGAFHTPLMKSAAEDIRAVFAAITLRRPTSTFVANDAGRPITEPEAIADELMHQLTHPVRWVQCVEFMAGNGATRFIEVGPGRVLTGLIKRIVAGVETMNISGAESVAA